MSSSSSSSSSGVASLSPSSPAASPHSFFTNYITTRKPCHFTTHFQDTPWALHQWSNEYLKTHCHSEVKVEYRDSPEDRFGKGKEIQMKYNKFIEEIENGNELYYMTTQKLEYTAEGQACILSPPMSSLEKDFPINPPIMGNLVVQNINMWMGASSKPVTSGLHHDYHDNLYIVLRGTKQLTLFAPEEHPNMYTVGELEKLHPNGRVNYKGCPTRADGADEGAAMALQASMKLEKAMFSAKKDEGDSSDNESDIENALEELLDAQIACNDDDYSDSGEDDMDDDYEEDDDIPLDLPIPHSVLNIEKNKRGRVDCADEDSEDNESCAVKKKHKEMSNRNVTEDTLASSDGPPPNFSRVDTALSSKELAEKFPKYLEAKQRGAELSVTLNAGEMLYLPAGWFHEVRSVGAPPEGHMAVNFWFHPPDSDRFDAPYADDFWKKDWELRLQAMKGSNSTM